MKAFRVSGHFHMGHNLKQPFTKQFAGEDEAAVRERTLSDIGSRHGVGRRRIQINEITEVTNEEDFDPIVRHMIEKQG